MITMNIHGRLSIFVDDREVARKDNVITNAGLDAIGSTPICDLFRHCAAGDGSTPEKRTSQSTGSSSGGTFTASAGIFTASDVGNTIKMSSGSDTGAEAEILSYVSTTQVTVDGPNMASGTFDVHNTSQEELDNEVTRVSKISTGPDKNRTSYSSGTITHTRTFVIPANGSNATYREFGFSPTDSGWLFSRVVLNENLPVAAGKALLVQYSLDIDITPGPSVSKSGASVPTIAGWPIAVSGVPSPSLNGTERLLGLQFSKVGYDGNTIKERTALEPSGVASMAICTTSTSHGSSFPYDEGANPVGLLFVKGATNVTSGRVVNKTAVFQPGDGALDELNENYIREASIGTAPRGDASYRIGVAYAFDYPQTKKDSAGTSLSLTYSVGWGRDLN